MASKRTKKVKQAFDPPSRQIREGGNVDAYYSAHPSWRFHECDKNEWSIDSPEVREIFCGEILRRIRDLEAQTWREILIDAKKENHSIPVEDLTPKAAREFSKLNLDSRIADIISLRVTGSHRIYGFIEDRIFHVIWIDLHHGNNDQCVCRSNLKHT